MDSAEHRVPEAIQEQELADESAPLDELRLTARLLALLAMRYCGTIPGRAAAAPACGR